MKYTLLLTGKMRAGKDELAKIMIKLDPSLRRMAFADELKRLSAEVLGIPVEDLHDPEKKKLYRDRLIFGGNLVRAIAPHTWADHIYYSDEYQQNNVIITDARYPNEIENGKFLAKDTHRKVLVVRIEASDEIREQRGANPEFEKDVSEISLDSYPYDVRIRNESTVEELEKIAVQLYNYIYGKN
jgi:hypothetical protein